MTEQLIPVRALFICFAIVISNGIALTSHGGPFSSSKIASSSAQTIEEVQAQAYGTKPTIAVMEFENKTGSHNKKRRYGGVSEGSEDTLFGSGLKEQLVTALAQTNAFILVERQAINDVIVEQNFGASGMVKEETASTIGEIEGANFLIYGAITEYEVNTKANRVLSGNDEDRKWRKIFKTVTGALKQDHVAIDFRIVDSKTGRILSANSVEGKPREFSLNAGGLFGASLSGIGGHYKSPIQKAVRACMIKAVNWIGDNLLMKSSQAQPAQPVAKVVTTTTPDLNKPKGGVEKRLLRLKRMHKKGIITEKEYKERKSEILKEY